MQQYQASTLRVSRRRKRHPEPVATALNPAAAAHTVVQGIRHYTNRPEHQAATLELQRQMGNQAVAHTLQRRVLLAGPTNLQGVALPAPWNELAPAQRRAFLRAHRHDLVIQGRPRVGLARRVLDDMAAAGDDLHFSSESELFDEVRKRVATAIHMRLSQGIQRGGRWVHAFGYPNRPPAPQTGPQVNEAARAYWGPVQYDGEGSYYFELAPAGRANPLEAINRLFVFQQDPTRRTLIHCDYLTSVLHMRAFAEQIGADEFQRRVASGRIPLVLKWNGFHDLVQGLSQGSDSTSLQKVVLSSPADLIIGDHVIFYNHPMYDALIAEVGGVWRLENAIVVDRRGGRDLFQGHGYPTPVTEDHLRRSMLRHIRQHVSTVRLLIRQSQSRNPTRRMAALSQLATDYPMVVQVGTEWRVQGTAFDTIAVDEPLRVPAESELPGLHNPKDYQIRVWRPVESR